MEIVKLSSVKADPSQPRQEFDPVELDLLEKSIASQGILQPLIVERMPGSSDYLLVDGERRFRASTRLGLKTLPVEILEPMTDLERFVRRFHIQEQHRPWTYFDKARAIKFMIEEGRMSPKDSAVALGLSPNVVRNLLNILKFSKRVQQIAEQRRLPWSYILDIHRATAEVEDPKEANKLEEAIFDKIESGIIRKGEDVKDYRRAIQKGGARIVGNIINNDDYTARQALAESKAGALKTYSSIRYQMGWMESMLNKSNLDHAYKEMPETDVGSFKRIIEKLEAFVKNAGHRL